MLSINRITGLVIILASMLLSACNNQESATDASSDTEQEAGQYTSQDKTEHTSADDTTTDESSGMPEASEAIAMLEPTQGNLVNGTVHFTAIDRGVRVVANITALSAGQHGFHIHEKGDCSAPDASSAGGHFNPTNAEHGAPDQDTHHIGDLGNIEANDNGRASLEQDFPFLSLTGENSIVGKAVVVHAGADDLESQPSGAAGARVACGVIGHQDQ